MKEQQVKEQHRTAEFARNDSQDKLLRRVNAALRAAEATLDLPDTPRLPVIMIVGAPRSGTTVLLQWLADSGCFAYPTNFIARFYGAPALGVMLQSLLLDPAFDYRGELSIESQVNEAWRSTFGKTRGALQPHEFFYFWRQHIPVEQAARLTDAEVGSVDVDGFRAGWAHLEAALAAPVACKGILLQYNIEHVAEWLPTAVFLHVNRGKDANMRSLLRARRSVLGTVEEWFSARPPGYEEVLGLSPEEQVRFQVERTNEWVTSSLARLPAQRSLSIQYEELCNDPARVWAELRITLRRGGASLPPYAGPSTLRSPVGVQDS